MEGQKIDKRNKHEKLASHGQENTYLYLAYTLEEIDCHHLESDDGESKEEESNSTSRTGHKGGVISESTGTGFRKQLTDGKTYYHYNSGNQRSIDQ